jgi:hypothetical protein
VWTWSKGVDEFAHHHLNELVGQGVSERFPQPCPEVFQATGPSPSFPRAQTAPEFPREVLDLPSKVAHRPKPHARLFRGEAMPVIAVPLALRAASAGRATMHPAPRPAMHRR